MGLRILVTNDDGYARARDEEPNPEDGDITGTLPNERINWVNSHPVTAARFGLDLFGPMLWSDKPCDLVISGPSWGWNTGYNVWGSGTLNIAQYAAVKRNIPAIAVSAQDAHPHSKGAAAVLYAGLVTKLVEALVEPGKPLLPENVWLSVHFPVLRRPVPKEDDFKWVLARIEGNSEFLCSWKVKSLVDDGTFDNCDLDNLPAEQTVLSRCLNRICISINTDGQRSAPREDQILVKERLNGLLACSRGGQGGYDSRSTSANVDGEHHAEEA
ncbi:hypothetical protein SLS62_000722 [Diatrype stigma]|uniref:Survival protein SurE-like phosphatase/nucleotidase domain-containing protein n=1 Tax=Diatrype stigma TaxID=117547 RepID=A0AAN9YSC1_9PEZI